MLPDSVTSMQDFTAAKHRLDKDSNSLVSAVATLRESFVVAVVPPAAPSLTVHVHVVPPAAPSPTVPAGQPPRPETLA